MAEEYRPDGTPFYSKFGVLNPNPQGPLDEYQDGYIAPTQQFYQDQAARQANFGLDPNNPILQDKGIFPNVYGGPSPDMGLFLNNTGAIPQMIVQELMKRAAINTVRPAVNNPALRTMTNTQALPQVPQQPLPDLGQIFMGVQRNNLGI